jgi:hypothetical protein
LTFEGLGRLFRALVNSPLARIIVSSALTTAIAVCSNTFASDIQTKNGTDWGIFWKSHSFYFLAVVTVVFIIYQRAAYLTDVEIARFRDVEYCRAYMRSQCLPELASRSRDAIRNGHDDAITKAMEDLKALLQ